MNVLIKKNLELCCGCNILESSHAKHLCMYFNDDTETELEAKLKQK